MLNVCLLGCGGHAPLPRRRLTSLLLNSLEDASSVLIDCGEGTQVAIAEYGWKMNDISVVCITHLHADHVAGLSGLLSSMQNQGRTKKLIIIGPTGLKNLVKASFVISGHIKFYVQVIEVDRLERDFLFFPFKIEMLRVDHSCVCYAYKVTAMQRRKCLPDLAQSNGVPIEVWSDLLESDSVLYKKVVYSADQIAEPRKAGITISYCTDTRPTDLLPDFIKGSKLLIAEGMYYEEQKSNALRYKHMTYKEAAAIARDGGVPSLWLTHFSPTISKPKDYLSEALSIFKQTQVGVDGKYEVFAYDD